MTAAVPGPGIDTVLAALELPRARTVDRMPGLEATVWRASLADGRQVAVRVLPAGATADREVAALRLAATLGQPVPQVVGAGVCEWRAVVATTWCPGRSIGDLLAEGADPAELGGVFGAAQAHLHVAVPAGSPLAALGPSPVLRAAPTTSPEPPVLAHLDYQPFNVMAGGGRVTGIVGWANAAAADRRADLARTWAILSVAQVLVPVPRERISAFMAGWRSGYAAVRPLPSREELAPFIAAAGAVLGAEWAPRVVDGDATLAVLHAIDELIDEWD